MKHLRQRRTLAWLGLLLAFALVVAACGDDDAETTTTTEAAATTTTAAEETTTTAAAEETTTTAAGEETTTTAAEAPTGLAGLRVVDDLTFEVELSAPDPEFPLRLAYAAYFPLPDAFFEMDPAEFEEMPIGNGKFQMAGPWEHDVLIPTVAYADYAGPDPAQVEELNFQIFGTVETAYQEALAGNLDIVDSIPDAFLETYTNDFPLNGEAFTTGFNYLGFPTYLDPPYTKEVRAALSMAIDQQLITDTIFLGLRDPAFSVIPPNLAGARDTVCDNWSYDPDAAKALWDSIAEKPEELVVWFNQGGGHENWVEAVVNMWNQNLGIDPATVSFETLEFSEYLPKLDNQEVTGPFRLGWGQDYPSPYNFLDPLYASYNAPPVGSNNTFYNNPDFDQALADGVAAFGASGNIEDAIPFYNTAEDILCDDTQVIPMFFSKAQFVWNEGVDNVFIDSYSDLVYHKLTADDGEVSTFIVEPEHLIPTTSNESEGIAVLRALFSPLINFDEEGTPYNVVAESVSTPDGGTTWVITVADGWTFHDGTPVTAASFVNAWNYGADGANGQQNNSFYASIVGYDELNPASE